MAQFLAIAFFAGLLIALVVILEQMVKRHWAEIVTALRGDALRPERRAIPPRPARRAAA